MRLHYNRSSSERERLYITAHYYSDSGQLEKGIAAYELYKQTYPHDATPYVNLAATYVPQLGQFEKALETPRKVFKLTQTRSVATNIPPEHTQG